MSVINKNSARLRDEERARLIWLLTTDKAIISTLLGKLTLAEQYDVGTLADDIAEVGALVAHLPPPDLADTLEALPSEERHALWRLVENEKRGNVLLEASENVWDDLIDEMSDRELLDALQYLDIDEQIYLVQHLPRNLTGRLLATLPAEERTRVRQVLHYEKNSVGAIMEFEVITVRPDVTLEVVQRYLRRLGKMPENTDKLFVTDRNKVLVGELTLTCILLNDVQRKVSEVMEDDPLTFSPEDIAENAARTFERDNLVSAAVVDPSGKLMGRLTIDEIVDVVYEETDTDLRRMGGLSAEEDVFAPVTKAVKTRWAWLAVNLCTAFIASRVIDGFEHTISQLVALASLMPIVAGIGGNTGNQTITMIVRALALQNIQPGNLTFLILREMGVALINGLVWGGIMGGITWWLYDDMALGGVMTLAMMLNLLMAALMGVIIPMTMVKLGRDPAVGSSVMITAITDTGGFFIFLGLATLFLM
ncbi:MULTISPECIES: magnesium transporter [Citrobacter]|jgi:magnesium transporter|uniref:Magnesium transporter MgtE n=1 Tax=Citrobacter portucalensis TaxID=1639133 RepID=A0A5B0T115_9ENTR|nr:MULTISPECIES: magnesium transporter [Citrobacter]ATX92437.1 magnesium transporter [Citrobacter freundii]AUV44525.1 magnesium transporter [Citrobacter freundii complex sp. CFNIH9]AVD78819.1 magnesium transporter [Citrobacter freundii]EEH93718.1 magnesium transporter [Citrobacter portucalensis]EGS5520720.1 magnesium transporter [Citrobacter freundii]